MAPKVHPQDLDANIAGTTYTLLPDGRTTVCQITLLNGFSTIGTSACIDAANYDKALGEKYAFENAKGKMWPVLGAVLADRGAGSKLVFAAELEG